MTGERRPTVDWIEGRFELDGLLPRPDWVAVRKAIEAAVPKAEWSAAFDAAAVSWLARAAESLAHGYHVLQSRNFLLLSPDVGGQDKTLLRFLEHALRTILETLDGIAMDRPLGRHVVLVMGSLDLYYHYAAWFYPSGGSYPITGGLFLGGEYEHLVIPWKELVISETASAHELTHACLSHLPIPAWLNEGMATVMEGIATGRSRLILSPVEIREQKAYWTPEAIQSFWSGASFHRADDGFELGYTLGYLAVKALSHDMARFRRFVLGARAADAGRFALREVFGGGLGDVLAQILGPGNWRPRPETWHVAGESGEEE